MNENLVNENLVIVKVGGSLFDLPDLKLRLARCCERARPTRVVFVPGGGSAANVIRSLDITHGLGEEAAHWLAMRMVQVNGCFLKTLLAQATIVRFPHEKPRVGILDAYDFARADEARDNHLPHIWDVTSDSLAARVAVVFGAEELVLLKSVGWEGDDWQAAASAGVVDRYFPEALRPARDLAVRVVNSRAEQPPQS